MRFWDRIAKYQKSGPWSLTEGWASVPAERFFEIFDSIFPPKLEDRGFKRIERQRWVRSRLEGMRDVVELVSLKGDSYSARWGMSLDFVPTVAASGKLGWHRTEKSARCDLVFDPLDYRVDSRIWSVTRSEHESDLPVVIGEWCDLVVPALDGFFNEINSLAELETAFATKETRPFSRFGPDNYVQHFLGHAFVLQKLGRREAAQAKFARFQGRSQVAPTVEEKLLGFLASL